MSIKEESKLCEYQLQAVLRIIKNPANQIQHEKALINLVNNFVRLWQNSTNPTCKDAVKLAKSFIEVTTYNLENDSVAIF